MSHFRKGSMVYLKNPYNDDQKYIIRSIGKKRAIVDAEQTTERPYRGRGIAYEITPTEEAKSIYGDDIPSYVKTSWRQHFKLANTGEWDPKTN